MSDTGNNNDWWTSLTFSKDNLITHEMLSQAVWHAVMMAALEIRYKFLKHLPKMTDKPRQVRSAQTLILKLQVLHTIAHNLNSKGIILPNGDNFKRLSEMESELEGIYAKRYVMHVY